MTDEKMHAAPAALAPDPAQDPRAGVVPPDRAPHQPAHLRADHLRRKATRCWPAPRRVEKELRAKDEDRQQQRRPRLPVGKRIAEKAKAAGVESVAFDRSGFRYHGRVKALADAAREAGLKF